MSGLRHFCERERFTGKPVHEEGTMRRIIQAVRSMSGLPSEV